MLRTGWTSVELGQESPQTVAALRWSLFSEALTTELASAEEAEQTVIPGGLDLATRGRLIAMKDRARPRAALLRSVLFPPDEDDDAGR